MAFGANSFSDIGSTVGATKPDDEAAEPEVGVAVPVVGAAGPDERLATRGFFGGASDEEVLV